MFSCPTVTAATPLRQTRVLIIAYPPRVLPVQWPWPTVEDTEGDFGNRHICISREQMAMLRRITPEPDYEPAPARPCQPVPSDRDLATAIFGLWHAPSHDLLLRGWCSPQGVRAGRWELCTLDDRVVAVIRYWDGVAVGHADILDAGGYTVERAFLDDGLVIGRCSLRNPIIEPTVVDPGPLPLGIPRRYTTSDGSRWEGLERDDRRVGLWLRYHSNGNIAAVQHYHLDSGAAIARWEYDHELGLRTEVRSVFE